MDKLGKVIVMIAIPVVIIIVMSILLKNPGAGYLEMKENMAKVFLPIMLGGGAVYFLYFTIKKRIYKNKDSD